MTGQNEAYTLDGVSIGGDAPGSVSTDGPPTRPGEPLAVTVYPNPFEAGPTAAVSVDRPGRYTAEVVDLLGRRVLVRELQIDRPGTRTVPLALDGAAAGVYVLRVRRHGDGTSATVRITRM